MRRSQWSPGPWSGRLGGGHNREPGANKPPWWPYEEPWPPRSGPGAQAWSGFGRRMARLTIVWFGLVIVAPLLIGVFLAVTVGGWTSVAIAVVSWAGLAVVLGIGLRVGLRSWRPVRSLIETAGRLADGDYDARAEPAGRAPLRPVIDSFNHMAERLERTETERRRLLADVGHEFRTPLTIIRGELEAMADGIHDPDEKEIRRLLGDVDVMERLLDDLATLSTAEAGMLTVHREPTEVVGLVRDVVGGLQAEAAAAGVTMALRSDETEIDADIDPVRVREIVANVVANALRATSQGDEVAVSVHRDGQDVTIAVADTGRGIPAADVDRVFDRFNKGVGSTGSGLGLTISRNLALAHGGDMTLTSEEGAGTTVTTQLPLQADPLP